MDIILNSYSGYGAWFLLRFLEEGHSVDYYLEDKKYEGILSGMAPRPFFVAPKSYEKYDLSLFDLTGRQKLAEKSLEGCPTIGDGNIHCMLEADRAFGIQMMEECGINVPPYQEFNDIQEAKKFIRETKKRYVFKPDGGQEQDTATTYVSESAEDLLNYLDKVSQDAKGSSFILQEVVEGTEVSTEAWFNGEDFYLINATLEEKKFMDNNRGPNTGCSGNLVWVYNKPPKLFEEGLGKTKDMLKSIGFRGMIDLNTIVDESKVYGLEWTPRFGYDASATLFQLLSSNLGEFMHAIASGDRPDYTTNGRYAAGIRLSIPPYPSEIEGFHPEGVPIQVKTKDLEEFAKSCFFYDAFLADENELMTAGINGSIAVPFGTGDSIEEAFYIVNKKIDMIKVPNMQYRGDILKTTTKRYEALARQGWLR